MDTLDLNLSRTMHERMLAAAPLLNASSFRRMHTIACWPSPCFLCGCYADARHGSELFPDELRIRVSPRLAEVLSLSRTRTPHAVSSTTFVFIDRAGGGSGQASFAFQNLAPLFHLPLNLLRESTCRPYGEAQQPLRRA
jgi:hypothetical protein